MEENKCPKCGAANDQGTTECSFCGEKLAVQQEQPQAQQEQPQAQQPQPQVQQEQPQAQQPQPQVQQPQPQQQQQQGYAAGVDPSWPVKSKIAAGVLGICLGGIGVHKFYMGKIGLGIVYLLFCWTGIPAIVGLIEGIIYLCASDEDFQQKYHVRVG